jgi:hypothetical protein
MKITTGLETTKEQLKRFFPNVSVITIDDAIKYIDYLEKEHKELVDANVSLVKRKYILQDKLTRIDNILTKDSLEWQMLIDIDNIKKILKEM